MGASGEAYFCKNHHLMDWLEEHLVWDDNLWEHDKQIRNSKCVCGAEFLLSVAHYGSLNDCVCLENEEQEKGIIPIGKDKIMRKVPKAKDKNGNPIIAYEPLELTKYRIPEDIITGERYETNAKRFST